MDVHVVPLAFFPWDFLGVSELVTDADLTRGRERSSQHGKKRNLRVGPPRGAPGSVQRRRPGETGEAEGRGSVSPLVLLGLPAILTRNVPLPVTHQPAHAHGGSPLPSTQTTWLRSVP